MCHDLKKSFLIIIFFTAKKNFIDWDGTFHSCVRPISRGIFLRGYFLYFLEQDTPLSDTYSISWISYLPQSAILIGFPHPIPSKNSITLQSLHLWNWQLSLQENVSPAGKRRYLWQKKLEWKFFLIASTGSLCDSMSRKWIIWTVPQSN